MKADIGLMVVLVVGDERMSVQGEVLRFIGRAKGRSVSQTISSSPNPAVSICAIFIEADRAVWSDGKNSINGSAGWRRSSCRWQRFIRRRGTEILG